MSMAAETPANLVLANITAVAIAGRALLIEGPPQSGKTSLALALIDRGAVLIGDDGLTITIRNGAAWAGPPPNISGLIEIRNVGLVPIPTTSAPIALVLRLDPDAARFPLELDQRMFGDCAIPALPFCAGDAIQALRAEYALTTHGLASQARAFRGTSIGHDRFASHR